MRRLILTDTGPILHLHEINRIYLFRIFTKRELILSNLIRNELTSYGVSLEGLEKEGIRFIISHVKKREIRDMQASLKDYRLQNGDISVVFLALKFNPDLVLTDDMELRKAIVRINLKPVGTFGIVISAWRKGILSRGEVDEIIKELFEKSTLCISKGFKKYIIFYFQIVSPENELVLTPFPAILGKVYQ